MYAVLKEDAETNRRSLNAEILVRLEESVRPRRPASVDVARRVAARAKRLTLPVLTDALLRDLKREGRL